MDDVPEGAPYGIPPDNPFADGRGGASEVWAWGLRNVWRMRFDRSSGLLWAGDVGQGTFEEIDIIVSGNYGWRGREGFACYLLQECDGDFIQPVHTYGRDEGISVTGGAVYRGPDLPELWGAYVFADYGSGRVWALMDGEAVLLSTAGSSSITSFGEDAQGRLYLTSFRGNAILTLRREVEPEGEPFPQRLSETGCFRDTAAHVPAAGLVPYGVNVPLWSDGVAKLRYLALPAGAQVGYRARDAFELPVGTVLVKTFVTEAGRRLETRLLTRQAAGWRGFTWRWNEEQTDAFLLEDGLDEVVDGLDWRYPSRTECDQCHTDAAGHTLGWRGLQLSGRFEAEGVQYDQLPALVERGYLDEAPARVPAHPRPDDEGAPVADRARAYLDANCAMCHQPDGLGNARIDLRANRPLAEARLCDVEPDQGDLGIEGARLLAPGAPDQSVLLERMERRGEGQMPPLASRRVDPEGTGLVRRWVLDLVCP